MNLEHKVQQLEAALTRARRPVPTREQVDKIVSDYALGERDEHGEDIYNNRTAVVDAIVALMGEDE